MFLRTKIFRQLVLFAFIPSLIIGFAAYYMLFEALDRAGAWISVSSPDRTINSLRLAESRLQDLADIRLRRDAPESEPDSLLDWWLSVENDHVTAIAITGEWPDLDDSLINRFALDAEVGPVREVIDDYLILGSVVSGNGRKTAGGFILDREYLDGFTAVTGDLSRRRRFSNIFPGLRLFLVVAGLSVLIFIIVVAYLLSRRLSRSVSAPLVELTEATAAASAGDYSQRIAAAGTDEVRRLTDTFNRMLADLEDSRRRLVDAERVAAWQEFARRMAHELKNPLTPISLSLYRIKKALQDSGRYDRFSESIEAISTQVARLERLAEDYSSLAKLPAPKMKSFDFTDAVNNLVTLYRPQLDTYRFEAKIPNRTVMLTADPDHLNQVMVNLIKNAIEFTPPDGRIILSVRRGDRRIIFSLANDSDEVHRKNLDSARLPYFSTREGGSGLGLAVSEKIIVDHGGSLSLEVENDMAVARLDIPVGEPEGVQP
jgi:signal transduction histidine kinase